MEKKSIGRKGGEERKKGEDDRIKIERVGGDEEERKKIVEKTAKKPYLFPVV